MSERVKPADAFETVFVIEACLADNEWAGRIMQDVAERILRHPDNLDKTPLVVRVVEHGGWALSYTLIDNVVQVVSSANDQAQWSGEKARFRDRAYFAKWESLGTVRRNETMVPFSELAVGEKFYNGEHQWEKMTASAAKKVPHYTGDDEVRFFREDVRLNRVVPVGWDKV